MFCQKMMVGYLRLLNASELARTVHLVHETGGWVLIQQEQGVAAAWDPELASQAIEKLSRSGLKISLGLESFAPSDRSDAAFSNRSALEEAVIRGRRVAYRAPRNSSAFEAFCGSEITASWARQSKSLSVLDCGTVVAHEAESVSVKRVQVEPSAETFVSEIERGYVPTVDQDFRSRTDLRIPVQGQFGLRKTGENEFELVS